MKNLIITLICCCFLFQLSAQFNTTFSTGPYNEFTTEVATDCSSSEGLFAGLRFDFNGNPNYDQLVVGSFNKATGIVDNPVFVYPNSSSPISFFRIADEEINLETIKNANGVCEGYFIIISAQQSVGGEFDLNLIRLDLAGNLVYALTLYENNGSSELCNELTQNSSGQMVFTGSITGMQASEILVGIFDLTTFSINDKKYTFDVYSDGAADTCIGEDLIEVSGTNTAAKYAIVGRAGGLSLLMLVDNNLAYVDHQLYDLDSDPSTYDFAESVVHDGSNFWITGKKSDVVVGGSSEEYTYVLNVNGVDGIVPLFDWNWGNDFLIPGSESYPTDMEIGGSSNSVVVAGISNLESPPTSGVYSDSYLMEVGPGVVNWAYNHNYANHEGGLFDIEKNGNNFFLAGFAWEDPTNVLVRLQIVSTDLNGQGNAGCYEDLVVEVRDFNQEILYFPPEEIGILSPMGDLPYTFVGVDTPQESCNPCPEEPNNIHFDVTKKIQIDLSTELLDLASDVIQDPDGNYVAVGITFFESADDEPESVVKKPYIIKFDALGNTIAGPFYFDHNDFFPDDNPAPKIQPAFSNSGSFIGYTVLTNMGGFLENYIVVTGFNPDLTKNCAYELNNNVVGAEWIFNDFIQNGNELFIIGKASGITPPYGMMVFKSNLPFNCSYTGTPPLSNYQFRLYDDFEEGLAICKFSNGTMGITGNKDPGSVIFDVFYANLLPDLSLNNFGPPLTVNYVLFDVDQNLMSDHAVSIAERPDGRVVIAGNQGNDDQIFLIELDKKPILNNTTIALVNTNGIEEELTEMKIKPNGNIVLHGTTVLTGGVKHSFLSVLDPTYNELSYSEYFNSGYDFTRGGAFDITNDNGLIIAHRGSKPGCSPFCLDEFDSKFTKTGPLGYLVDCECYEPTTINVVVNPQIGSIFLHPPNVTQIDFEPEKDVLCEQMDFIDDVCNQGIGNPMVCDIQTTSQLTQNDSCCATSLSLSNNMMGAYKIQIDLVNPASLQFDWIQTDPAFCIQPGSFSSGSVIVEMCSSGPLPQGNTPDYLQFCMMDSVNTSNLQDFKITYLNAACSPIPDCMDFLQTECPIGPVDLDCYEIVMDTVICDTIPGLFDVCFTVKNNNSTAVLKWLDLSAANILFLGANPICLSPPVSPGGGISAQICTQIYDNSGLPLPRTIKLDHAAHDSLYQYCCQDLDSLCVVLPSCCDPCESDWVTLDSISTGIDSCCFALDVLVDCPLSLTKVITESLTPGVVFGSVYVGGPCALGWNITSFSSSVATFTPVGTAAPVGFCDDLINFCLKDTLGNVPLQQVAVHYIMTDVFGVDSIACSDTLEFNCNMDVECLEITQDSVYCDANGDYFLDFCVKNIAFPTFTADKLVIRKKNASVLDINPKNFNGISIPPQSTFCGTVQIISPPFFGPFPGQKIVLDFAMHETNAIGQDTCCQDTEELCVVLPPCNDCCEDFNIFCSHVQPNTVIYGVCDSAYVSIAYADSCTYADIDWGDGTTETHIGTFATTHFYNTTGTYTVCADYKESSDGGQTFCWNKLVCNTITIDPCPSDTFICDNIDFDSMAYLGWAVATCHSGDAFSSNPQGYVCGIADIRNHATAAPNGSNWWGPTMYHGTGANEWTGTNIGEVFGLAVDPKGNIYTSSASFYHTTNLGVYVNPSFGSSTFNPSGKPSIYKLNPYTSAITNLNSSLPQIPDANYSNQYPSFGNLCYNYKNELLYVSNLEDGIIYALDANTGSIMYQFDHGAADNTAGFAPLGDRIFGIGYNHVEDRVYYGIWVIDNLNRAAGTYNEIWSIKLGSDGRFVGVANKEFDIPYLDNLLRPYSNPVADISFDVTGKKMLLSERTMFEGTSGDRYVGTKAHDSRTLEYVSNNTTPPFSNSYVANPVTKFNSTTSFGRNSTGGNDYAYGDSSLMDCDSFVVMTEDAIGYGTLNFIYGIRGVANSGGTNPNWMIDLDQNVSSGDKYLIGDVEVYRNLCCEIPSFDTCDFTFNVLCTDVTLSGMPSGGTAPYTYDWDIDCDGTIDISGQNPTWTFPSVPPVSTHCIKMIVTDATGISCEVQKQVTVEACPPAGDFKKIYGSAEDEKPRRMMTLGDGVYVIGERWISGQRYGTFAKYDIVTGALICEQVIDELSYFNDFDYNPTTAEFVVVGATESTSLTTTKSLICTFSTSCQLTGQKIYDHSGSEEFTNVVVHKNPFDSNRPIYVNGYYKASGQPRITMLYNFTNSLGFNFKREYPEITNLEIRGHLGLKDLANGELLLLGSETLTDEGVLLNVDGNSGSLLQSLNYSQFAYLYDAIEMTPGGNILLSGTDFGSDFGLLMVVDPAFNVISSVVLNGVYDFEEVFMDAYNNIYVYGQTFQLSKDYNVMHKLTYDPVLNSFTQVWAKYLDEGEQDYDFNPRLFVSEKQDKIYFADGRFNHPNGFGGWDVLVGATDLDFSCLCSVDFNQSILSFPVTTSNLSCNDILDNVELPLGPLFVAEPIQDSCITFCPNILECDFTFTTDCFTVSLNGIPSGGTGPYTYAWDVDCNGPIDITGQNSVWTFPSLPATSTHCIKMIITDAAGDTCEIQKQVTVQDLMPPVLNCPGNITLNTDPGLCIATYMMPTAIDDCDPSPILSCQLTGATTGDETTTQFNLGVTTVICTAVDASGNMSTCTFTITVVDQEAPVIVCPSDITMTIPGCDGGVNVTFPAPVFSDNCPIVSYVCTHQSGDYFPCGNTTVTCTATDNAGNTSTCTFNVNVVCECAELFSSSILCNPTDENVQDFTITLTSLAGLPNPQQFCTASVTTTQMGVTLSNISTSWTGQQVTISGSATIMACPDQLNLIANMTCACPNAPVLNCDISVPLSTLCCKTIAIDDADVCRTGPTVSVPLLGCNNLCDIQQVKWYVVDAPCPPSSWGAPFQVTNSCLPLLIDPQFHSGDICIYAEVFMGQDGGPCKPMLTSNPATITLCDPVGCSVAMSQNYCYTGTSITPNLLMGSVNPAMPNCPYTVQWFEGATQIPGETQLNYQPPALSIPAGSTACSVSTTYTMKVTSECGVSECSATIKLDNDDAPLGLLEMDPLEPTPFCPGEDATLRYTPECAGTPPMWDWLISTDGISFTNITTAGTQNPLYNTNRLYQDTWYRVEKQNGTCAVDEVDLFIPVNGPLTINSFTAVHSPVCTPTNVLMSIDFAPIYPSPCDYTITWYRNGDVIHTDLLVTSSPAIYSYAPSPATPENFAGNYYAVVSNNCCDESLKSPVIQVDPLCEVDVLGPCFRCNVETVTLTGVVINPIAGAICTYEWRDENGIIAGATGTTLQIQPSQVGPFTFEVTCVLGTNTCVKSAIFDLKQCGDIPCTDAVEVLKSIGLSIYPNPTNGQLYIVFEAPVSYEGILLYDVAGKLIKVYKDDDLITEKILDISSFPDGMYLVKIVLDGEHSITRRVVKQ